MNSYQTVNAAAFAAGIPVRAAVEFGQAFHRGHYLPAETLGQIAHRDRIAGAEQYPRQPRIQYISLEESERKMHSRFRGMLRWMEENGLQFDTAKAELLGKRADVVIYDDIEPAPPGHWNDEDKARQLALKPVLRDQSEDRVMPRAVVVPTENPSGVKPGRYWAVHDRRNMRRLSVWFTSQGEADEVAESWEAEFGHIAWDPVNPASVNMVWGVPHTQADGYSE